MPKNTTDNTPNDVLSVIEMILEKVYLAGYRDSTRRASGAKPEAHVSGLKVMHAIRAAIQSGMPEYWLADPKYRNLAMDKEHSTDYFVALGHDKAVDQITESFKKKGLLK
jgi:hypothetical protein